MEESMRENSRWYSNRDADFNVCYNGVYLTTDNVCVTWWNKIYEHMYGYHQYPMVIYKFFLSVIFI